MILLPPENSRAQRYVCKVSELVSYKAGANQKLVYSRLTGALAFLPHSTMQILWNCQSLKTLDEHASSVSQKLGCEPYQQNAVRAELDRLVKSGFLIRSFDLLEQARSTVSDSNKTRISAVCIPTKNRPQALAKSLEGFANCASNFGHDMRFFVADQSDEEAVRNANLEILRKVKSTYNVDCFYGGFREKEELASRLSDHVGAPLEHVRFAVLNEEACPLAVGANRNALLLATAGSMLLQTDDDTECKLLPSPMRSDELQFSDEHIPLQMRFLSESEASDRSDQGEEMDVFALHEALLGKSITDFQADVASSSKDQTTLSYFAGRGPKKVAASFLGAYGIATIGTSYYFLIMEGARDNLVRSEDVFRYAMKEHQIEWFCSSPIITNRPFSSSMSLGLDNTDVLPPFAPVQRNQDGIFGMLLSSCAFGFKGYQPWMLRHSHEGRSYDPSLLKKFVSGVRFNDMLLSLIEEISPKCIHPDPLRNLKSIGQALIDWGESPERDFSELLRFIVSRHASWQIETLDKLLSEHSMQPDYWAKEVEMCAKAIREAVLRKRYFVPSDLAAHFGETDAAILTQRLVRRFGNLLKIWPDLHCGAKELLKEGWEPFIRV